MADISVSSNLKSTHVSIIIVCVFEGTGICVLGLIGTPPINTPEPNLTAEGS